MRAFFVHVVTAIFQTLINSAPVNFPSSIPSSTVLHLSFVSIEQQFGLSLLTQLSAIIAQLDRMLTFFPHFQSTVFTSDF